MSKFLSYYNLFPIPDPKEFLGIAADSEEGNVVTTLARNVVVILNISTQKQLRSWSMPEKLSTKVVYDRNSQKYVGVFGNHSLRLWEETTSDVSKCKKLKFQKSIAHLVPTETEAFVLYNDGSCELLSTALVSRKDHQADTAEQLSLAASKTISKATVHTLPQGQQLLSYFEQQRATGEIELVCLLLTSGLTKRYSLKRENNRLTGYAVIEGDSAPHLLTIWSDKRIFMLNLVGRTVDRAPGQFVSMLSELNVENQLTVHGVSRNFVAIYGANFGQEGASLLVYNTQFKVVNAKQYFKVFLNFSRLWSRGEHILLTMGQNIAAVRYRMNQELLIDMIGSQFSDTHVTPIELDIINEEEALEGLVKFAGTSTSDKPIKHPKVDNESSVTVADNKTVAYEPPEEFENDLTELIKQHVHGEVVCDDSGIEDMSITLMSNFSDKGSANTTVQTIARQLERSGAGEHEITEKLLTLFIKTNASDHVLLCLRRYSNISERMLAWSLRYALDNSPADLANGHGEAMDVDDAQPRHELINAVLSCNFDVNAIEQHLNHRLSMSHVLQLVHHLYELTTEPDVQLEERPQYDASLAFTERQAIKWFGAILTSHFTMLTISKDAKILAALEKWSELLKLYAEGFDQLQDIVPLITKIVEKRKFEPKYDNAWYTIEDVVLF